MKKLLMYFTTILFVLILVGCSSNKRMSSRSSQEQISTQNSTEDSETIAMKKEIERIRLQHEYDSLVMANAKVDPCYVEDDDKYFREYGISVNINKASAQSMSIDVAIENLKKHIGETIHVLSVSYSELYSGPMSSDEIQRKIERRLVSTTDGYMLNHKKKICQKWNKDKRGNYVYYTAFEVSKEELKPKIAEDIKRYSKSEKHGIEEKTIDELVRDAMKPFE